MLELWSWEARPSETAPLCHGTIDFQPVATARSPKFLLLLLSLWVVLLAPVREEVAEAAAAAGTVVACKGPNLSEYTSAELIHESFVLLHSMEPPTYHGCRQSSHHHTCRTGRQ